MVRTLQEVARENDLTIAFLFADLKDAFYSAIIQFVYGNIGSTSDNEIIQKAQQYGVTPSALTQLIEHIREAAILTDNAIEKTMTAELCTGNYFLIDGTNQVSCPTRGSRPGDSYADILFNLVMAKIMGPVQAKLQEQRIAVEIEKFGDGTLKGTTQTMTTATKSPTETAS